MSRKLVSQSGKNMEENTDELLTKDKVTSILASLGNGGKEMSLFLGEDICFKQAWISVGKVSLHVEKGDVDELEARYNEQAAVMLGGFEWKIPPADELENNVRESVKDLKDQCDNIVKYFNQGLQDAVRRCLLLLPVFDVDSIMNMPYGMPITIVPDTTAVHQGALDFFARFHTPWARIKIPAIVYMEILNNSDNYFSLRRSKNKKSEAKTLQQHLLSQGGQGTLLRIELNSSVELERGDLGADPLRGIVSPSSDTEDKNLGLQHVVRSFGDRLIVETARHYQLRVRPTHPLAVLTSDQGLARMAMSEGLNVVYFQARSAPSLAGKKLTGTVFHPFDQTLYSVSLVDVLFELATAFGRLRISNEDEEYLELFGIAPDNGKFSWQPAHSKSSLLVGSYKCLLAKISSASQNPLGVTSPNPAIAQEEHAKEAKEEKQQLSLSGAYEISASRLFDLINALVENTVLKIDEVKSVLSTQSDSILPKYKNFLRSGNFITMHNKDWNCEPILKEFWNALKSNDLGTFRKCLLEIPSISRLIESVFLGRKLSVSEFPIPKNTASTYIALAESAGIILRVGNEYLVATDANPSIDEFVNFSKEVFQKLIEKVGAEWVLAGEWLEHLAIDHAIHPVQSRRLLNEAVDNKLLKVYTEGSTPDTRFEKHQMWILDNSGSMPALKKLFLYHGSFLISGTSSVRIKIGEP
jgi:hypothetical protein